MSRVAWMALWLAACAGPPAAAPDPGAWLDGKADGATDFDPDFVMSDEFYTDPSYASLEEIQAFLEATPWHRRCWLADYVIDGRPASEAIVAASFEHGLNPLMLLGRVQVESSLVSAATLPPGRDGEFAFGCHKVTAEHPNGLDPSVASFAAQLDCGTRTLRTLYDKVLDGSSVVRPGHSFRTDDDTTVVPANEATAALYSYTPNACPGNCLVWMAARKFDQHLRNVVRPSLEPGPPPS